MSGIAQNLSVLNIARLLRLARMARLVRLLRAVPELMVMVKGMAIATRSVLCALALLMVITYGFGIAMTQVSRDTPDLHEAYFGNVGESLWSLFLWGVIPDQADIVIESSGGGRSWMCAVLLLGCILLTTLTGVNMMAAALVEVVSAVSQVEKARTDLSFVKETLQRAWDEG